MVRTYTKQRRKFRKFKTYPHNYGPGKVHVEVWVPGDKFWVALCRSKVDGDRIAKFGFGGMHGIAVDREVETTCRKCQKIETELGL